MMEEDMSYLMMFTPSEEKERSISTICENTNNDDNSKYSMRIPRFYIPIIETLRELGGTGGCREVVDIVIEKLYISKEEMEQTVPSGECRVRNQSRWAKDHLAKLGYLHSSSRGVWCLDPLGEDVDLTTLDPIEMRKKVGDDTHNKNKLEKKMSDQDEELNISIGENTDDEGEDVIYIENNNYRKHILNVLRTIDPFRFEYLCKLLLREKGFEELHITKNSNDGGIDGHGIFTNDHISDRIYFQCKRYKGTVGSSHIRDLRGAIQGREGRGLFITTGEFTPGAKTEARREGARVISLLDGRDLINEFEKYKIGMIEKTTTEIDHKFFERYKKSGK